MTSPDAPIPRPTARVLLLDPEDRILLLHHKDASLAIPELWCPPGGGLEGDESHEEAAKRELWEELGLQDAVLGPCVWLRTVSFAWKGLEYEAREHYYVCHIDGIEISDSNRTDDERVVIASYRWWTADEIAAATDQFFVPRTLASQLRALLAGELPPLPIEVDI